LGLPINVGTVLDEFLKPLKPKVDKCDLMQLLLCPWVKWQQGENIDLLLAENTPRRISEMK